MNERGRGNNKQQKERRYRQQCVRVCVGVVGRGRLENR